MLITQLRDTFFAGKVTLEPTTKKVGNVWVGTIHSHSGLKAQLVTRRVLYGKHKPSLDFDFQP